MKDILRQALAQREKQNINDPTRIPSAVLLLLFYKDSEYHVLFTQRTNNVKEHKGQICFPGGAYQKGDRTLLETALRECTEEIGLPASQVEVLGELDDIPTSVSPYIVSPFVATFEWPYPFTLDQWETNEIIEVPVSALIGDGACHQGIEMVEGELVDSYFYHYQGKVIWGATARILNQFLEIFKQIDGKSLKPNG